MTAIYGVELTQLHNKLDSILSQLPVSLMDAWQKRHPNLQNPTARLASLAGVWLLHKSGVDGTLNYTDTGKPILRAADGSALAVSITHTDTYAFCAVSNDVSALGIDAEDIGRLSPSRLAPMAKRWFSPAEQADLDRLPTEEHFLKIWTHKEALVKLSGDGLRALAKTDTSASPLPFHHYRFHNTLLCLCLDGRVEKVNIFVGKTF